MLKKTLSTCVLLGVCCAPLAVVAQQDEHHVDHAQQQQADRHDGYSQQQTDRHDGYGQQQYVRHDDHAQQQYVHHKEWKSGYHMNHDDWDRGQQVDYRAYHLHQPRSGYEWRQVDGNYVMADTHNGVIASVVVSRH